jgi:hypothetical protein
MLSKSLSTSRKYGALYKLEEPLGSQCQAVYPLLVAHADDFGRLEGDPFTIKTAVVPGSNWPLSQVENIIASLAAVGLIAAYEIDGSHFVQIIDYDRHQSGIHKRTRSRYPEAPGISGNFREIPEPPGISGGFPEVPGVSGSLQEFPKSTGTTELNRTSNKNKRTDAGASEPVEISKPAENSGNGAAAKPAKPKTGYASVLVNCYTVLDKAAPDEGYADLVESAKKLSSGVPGYERLVHKALDAALHQRGRVAQTTPIRPEVVKRWAGL